MVSHSVALETLKLAVVGLIYLLDGDKKLTILAKPTALHLVVARRLCSNTDGAIREFLDCGKSVDIVGSFDRLTTCLETYKLPRLQADDVDVLDPAGRLDPLMGMPATVQELL